MTQADLDVFRDNLRLKKAFLKLNLDLTPIMEFMPYHLDIENRRLASLLTFVRKYQSCQSREVMELIGRPYPPIFPSISPESDWYRFKLWLNGEPVRKKLKDLLPTYLALTHPKHLSEVASEASLVTLNDALEAIGYGFDLRKGIPAKVMYTYLWETLEEEFELDEEGGWVLDGCSGYCPNCFQRPWCDTGLTSHWPEDKKAGKMELPTVLSPYLSASPISLAILKTYEEKEEFEPFGGHNQDSGYVPDPLNRELYEEQNQRWEDEGDLPFS